MSLRHLYGWGLLGCWLFWCVVPAALAAPTITTLDSTGSVGLYTNIAIGADGFPVIVYLDSDNNIKVAHCGNATCTSGNGVTTTAADAAPILGMDLGIAIGDDDLPVISFTNTLQSVLHCGNAACTASNVITEMGSNDDGETDIMIGTDGFPGVAYSFFQEDDLRIAFDDCGNATCSTHGTQVPVSSGIAGTDVAVALIGSNPAIVYDDGAVKLYACTATNCSTGGSQTLHASTAGHYDMAVGADGHPVVVIRNSANVRVVDCSTANCSSVTVSTIATNAETTGNADIAVGADGFPIVSYYGGSDDLIVVKCGDAECSSGNTTTTVDSTGSVGAYSSITIGDDDNPVVSYYDVTNGNLKVAACDNDACTESGSSSSAPVPALSALGAAAAIPMLYGAARSLRRSGVLPA